MGLTWVMCIVSFTATALLLISHGVLGSSHLQVGCFTKDSNTSGFSYESPYPSHASSVNVCVEECKQNMMRYAGLFSGYICYCGDIFNGNPSVDCTTKCTSNKTQICGGPESISIYESGHGILGAPQSLTQISSEPSMLHIAWTPPAWGLSTILEYQVQAIPNFTYNECDTLHPLTWQFSAIMSSAKLYGVHPGTKYIVKVYAGNEAGLGYPKQLEMWTSVGVPETPQSPELLSRTATTMTVKLHPVEPTNGPITAYQVVVVDETLPVTVQPKSLTSYQEAQINALPYYIAAQFTPNNFKELFTVGEGQIYGRYKNIQLKDNIDYHIVFGVLSTINETQYAYSPSSHNQHQSNINDEYTRKHQKIGLESRLTVVENNKLVFGLSIAIGICGFLLVLSVIIYIGLRLIVKRNHRRSSEAQELAINAHQPNHDNEIENGGINGYSCGAHYVQDETDNPNYYKQLKEKARMIPHQGLNIVGEIGTGRFGDVRKGIVIEKDGQINSLVHRIADDTLDAATKTQMLREFDAHLCIGSHAHVLSLYGLLEELSVINVAFEYETSTLKTHLVESRALQHYPVYAEKNRRFSTLQESQVIDILIGIIRGMNHLSCLGINHSVLCARNVVLVDGTRPKITGFGLLHYHNDLYVPDYRRWDSIETHRSKVRSSKSDIWSMGCLMWEAVTLGGTPYADVRSDELATRIYRGRRLQQPQYVGDELYQVMLNCWQNDADERPTFQELEQVLQNICNDDVSPHLLFSFYSSFQYEPYSPNLEFKD